MKLVTATIATAALLAFAGAGIAPAAHAQSDQQQQQDKTHPRQQQQKPQRPQRQQEQRPPRQQQQRPRQQQTQQKQQRQQQPRTQQRTQQRQAQQGPDRQMRGGHERQDPRQTAHYEQAHMRRYQPRGGEREVRIPDNDFHEHFGREHRFHMGVPVVVDGFPRFQYGGFWFVLEEPWPPDWYDSDDFYIVYDNGLYWLCNFDDPGVQVELAVINR